MTRAELLALPAAVDLVTAGRALGIGRTTAQTLARTGEWPTALLRLGKAYKVPTAALLRLLEVEHQQALKTPVESARTPQNSSEAEPSTGPAVASSSDTPTTTK